MVKYYSQKHWSIKKYIIQINFYRNEGSSVGLIKLGKQNKDKLK